MEVDIDYEGPYRENAHNKDKWRGHWRYNECPIKIDRLLESNMGRAWNDVHSYLCRKFRKPFDRYTLDDSWIGYWVYQQKDVGRFFISRRFEVVDGLIQKVTNSYIKGRYRYNKFEHLYYKYGIVHHNGIVYGCQNPENIWYELILGQPPNEFSQDAYFKMSLDIQHQTKFYGPNLICVRKRQLGKSDKQKLFKELYLVKDYREIFS